MEFLRTYEVLKGFSESLQSLYKQNLIDNNIPATGELVNSVQANVSINENTHQVVLTLEEYWKYIEYGRKPGKFPPPDKILSWVRSKPILPVENSGRIPTEKQLSFLIGRKISEKGIEARPILENTISDLYDQFINNITSAFADDVSRSAFQIISFTLNSKNWNAVQIK